ncbi:MAG: alpha/beta fold hydrolase [Thermoplasmata archaeon]
MRRPGDGSIRRFWLSGTGDPAVVLPDSPVGRDEWGRVALGLSRSLRVLVFDRNPVGWAEHGRAGLQATSPPEVELGELLRELDHWPTHLIGIGRGGGLALKVARLHPELVRGMVLHEPVVLPPAGAEARFEEVTALSELEQPVLVTAGSESPWGRRQAAEQLARQAPNARWRLLPGVTGRPDQESPDLWIAVVTEFLTVRSVPSS